MQAQPRRDTAPELALRRELHRRGLRYFVHRRPLKDLRREADIVFPQAKVAVFVDGDFWHGCPTHGRRKHNVNGWYWDEKIEGNKRRDADTDARLAGAGWVSVRVWECEEPGRAAARVQEVVAARRAGVTF